MPFLIALLLVVAVHVAMHVTTWTQVGLLADDHHMVGGAILRHRGVWTFDSMFLPEPVANATNALYRPFIDLGFWLEQPWFGIDALGYHVVNSAMHCATAILWFVLVRRLLGSIAAAVAVALLFVGWPGHSEALHWIAARTDVQSTFFLSIALVVLDRGLGRGPGPARAARLWLAAAFAVFAVGSKESAVFVLPLAAMLCWLRAPAGLALRRRAFAGLRTVAPMLCAVVAWLWWRASRIGTWGSGTHYGWHWQRVTAGSCADWLSVLVAPVHADYTSSVWVVVLGVLHAALLVVALCAWRTPGARRVVLVGGLLLLMGYLAGIGLEPMDPDTLENVRYTYEPALGLTALLGLGIATLPPRSRGAALAVLVLAHVIVLDGNRQSWLRAAAVYRRMEHDIGEVALRTQAPIRVLDAPGVYEGAFALLNGFTEFRFMQEFAPAGADLRGSVSSTQEWRGVLRELAAAAAAGQVLENTYTVQWDDGALVPFALDTQWPQQPWPEATLGYACVARTRPFAGSRLPVHVLVRTATQLELQLRAQSGARSWSDEPVQVFASAEPQTIGLRFELPPDVPAGASVEVQLVVRKGDDARVFALGAAVLSAR
ncbi:MAG TPA: hypothetical protein VFZ65_16145 [Planctomycetota bacterium]|nr:hypothetical protein [Planctomycetota bacterium]